MKTIRYIAPVALVAWLVTATLPASRAEADDFSSFSGLSTYYLNQRALIAPMIPPLSPTALDAIAAMILKGDYSFRAWKGWYVGWWGGPHAAAGELAEYDGQTLIVYEDLASASIKIATAEGKVIAAFKSEPFPDLSALKGEAQERALLAELNKRAVVLRVSFDNLGASEPGEPEDEGGGGFFMMSSGGPTELEGRRVRADEQRNGGDVRLAE
jgi:hypothetical protein